MLNYAHLHVSSSVESLDTNNSGMKAWGWKGNVEEGINGKKGPSVILSIIKRN